MTPDKCAKLPANVSAGTENADGFLIHKECIIIHTLGVNRELHLRDGMAHKTERHAAILELIGANDVASQEELRKLLQKRGVSATQATLSRDLREMGVVRVPGDDGARYALPDTVVADGVPSLQSLLPQLFSSVDGVGELIVLHTLASGAQPVSEAIDAVGWKEVLGTVAGENTILIVCRSPQARQEVILRLTDMARRG
jgi:transcriptional regulator of arginine metabolism